jgi:hypothetical protein
MAQLASRERPMQELDPAVNENVLKLLPALKRTRRLRQWLGLGVRRCSGGPHSVRIRFNPPRGGSIRIKPKVKFGRSEDVGEFAQPW